MIPILIGVLNTVTKGLIQGLEDLEIRGIQELTGNSLEKESWNLTNKMIEKTWPLADIFNCSLIGWFSQENGSIR